MKKILIIIASGLLISSCGLLFTTNNNESLNTLALSGGGTLSTDDYNEITPFMFHDTNGSAYLFFSSDREGTYDIYFSLMNSDGTFENPVRLPSPVNTTNYDEIYPVLFNNYSMNAYTMGFIRISNNFTNFQAADSYDISFTNLFLYTELITGDITGLGIAETFYGSSVVMSSNKGIRLDYMYFSEGSIYFDYSTNLLTPAYSANGFFIPVQNGHGDVFIKTVKIREKFQLAAELLSKTTIITQITFPTNYTLTNSFTIPNTLPLDPYASAFNDMSPFVDTVDDFKVYFASDRYGKGNYDLYRYNIYTFLNLPATSGLLPLDTSEPSVTFIGVTEGETISAGYINLPIKITDDACISYFAKVYISTNGSSFEELPQSCYSSDGLWYYYKSVPLIGWYSIYTYAIDWFGNTSETNSYNFYSNPV